MTRAVIDINVLVSAILGPLGSSRHIVVAWEAGKFVPIVSPHIVAELDAKLRLPSITRRFRITDDDRLWISELLAAYAELVTFERAAVPIVTGDPEDDTVLATVFHGKADYLVTGDKGLLARRTHGDLRRSFRRATSWRSSTLARVASWSVRRERARLPAT